MGSNSRSGVASKRVSECKKNFVKIVVAKSSREKLE